MHVVTCTHERHAQPIVDIFNEAILHSTALYDYTPRPLESMTAWFRQKAEARYPVIGIEDDAGTLLGFASYGQFRVRPAYKYTVEHSVYIHHAHRGKGLGLLLMQRLIEAAMGQDYHVMGGRDRRVERREHPPARAARVHALWYHPAGWVQVRALARSGVLPAHSFDATRSA